MTSNKLCTKRIKIYSRSESPCEGHFTSRPDGSKVVFGKDLTTECSRCYTLFLLSHALSALFTHFFFLLKTFFILTFCFIILYHPLMSNINDYPLYQSTMPIMWLKEFVLKIRHYFYYFFCLRIFLLKTSSYLWWMKGLLYSVFMHKRNT